MIWFVTLCCFDCSLSRAHLVFACMKWGRFFFFLRAGVCFFKSKSSLFIQATKNLFKVCYLVEFNDLILPYAKWCISISCQIPKVAATCNFTAIMDGYYKTLFPLNPGSIQPVMPSGCEHEALSRPHNRESLSSTESKYVQVQ